MTSIFIIKQWNYNKKVGITTYQIKIRLGMLWNGLSGYYGEDLCVGKNIGGKILQ